MAAMAQQPGPGQPLTRTSETEINANSAMVGRKAKEPQLKVLSKHHNIRGQIDAYSRGVRDQFRKRLGLFTDDSDDWTSKLYIRVRGTGADIYSGVETVLKGELTPDLRFKLLLDVMLHDRFDQNNFRLELIRMLLWDQMLNIYNQNPGHAQTKTMIVPDWLVYGFEYSLRHKELGRPSYFYSSYLENNQLINPGEIVKPGRAKGLTPLQLEAFQASSAILVDALCDQKEGQVSMRALLGDLAKNPNADCINLILKHFPAFRETNQGIDKWWALQLAIMSQQQSFEFHTPEETLKHLDAALSVNLAEYKVPLIQKKIFPGKGKGDGKGLFQRFNNKKRDAKATDEEEPVAEMKVVPAFKGTIADYQQFMAHPEYEKILISRFNALNGVKIKAFPVYRDVIDRYMKLCAELATKKVDVKQVSKAFVELDTIRKRISTVLPQCEDYLNHFEATQTPGRSQAFENYMQFIDKARSNKGRAEPLLEYLIEVEKVLSEPRN